MRPVLLTTRFLYSPNVVVMSKNPNPGMVRFTPPSMPSGSQSSDPIIWYPPQIPAMGTLPRSSLMRFAMPFSSIHSMSLTVFLVPGRTTASTPSRSEGFSTNTTETSSR